MPTKLSARAVMAGAPCIAILPLPAARGAARSARPQRTTAGAVAACGDIEKVRGTNDSAIHPGDSGQDRRRRTRPDGDTPSLTFDTTPREGTPVAGTLTAMRLS